MAKEIQQQAYVLHSRAYRESSRLVTFFTPEYGKMNAVIRGVRGQSKSAKLKQAWLQPFQRLTLSWRERAVRQSDLISLNRFEPDMLRFPLVGDACICGLYVNEIAYRLVYPSLHSESLFESYEQTLYALLKSDERNRQAWSLRTFEHTLLTEMGYGIELAHDMHGMALDSAALYEYYPDYGWSRVVSEARHGLELHDEEATRFHIRGECLIDFSEGRFNEGCLSSLKRLFRALLVPYLGDKPIQSRSLFGTHEPHTFKADS